MVKARPVLAMALVLCVATPPAFSRTTARQQQELEQLARDLNRALGAGAAEVHRPAEVPQSRRTSAVRLSAEALIDAMNRERAAAGLGPLHANTKLSVAANDRVTDMLAKHYFDHVSPDGIDPFTWVDKRGYDYVEIGENLAVGYHDAATLVDGWMRSPGHRANVMRAAYDEVGIAIAAESPTSRYAGPTVVAIYGKR
jgi:uncharacterized protein YkwD